MSTIRYFLSERCFLKNVTFLFAIIWMVINGINAENTCRKGCPRLDNTVLQYEPGKMYEYTFDTLMTIALNSEEKRGYDDTNLKLVGSAKLFAEGNCGFTLQLNPLKVTATKESIEKKIVQSIQKPVHFTMVNGKLEPELCVDDTDDVYALNIKRGIISLLQSNTENQSEIDVFGQCSTQTSITQTSPKTQIITKVRNLNNCAYREQINSGIVSGLVNEKSEIKSTLPFQADYIKELKIENGIISNVQLIEEYKFSSSSKISVPKVNAKVSTTLKLKSPGISSSFPNTATKSASLIFEKPNTHTINNISALKTALLDLIYLLNDYVHQNSAKHFAELIRLMRQADTETLLELGTVPHPNKILARKVYLDSLFRTGTAASAKAILKQLSKFEEKERAIAILSLNLVQSVDRETLNLAASLLNNNAGKEIFLAVGGILGKYCKQNSCLPKDIDVISKKFSDGLKNCKANTKKDEERIINVLKGIGNSQHLSKSVSSSLITCSEPGRQSRIRVAALRAFIAASCSKDIQNKALELLKNKNEDAEIRIEAYLALIQCPTPILANEIAEIVNSETVNQVGGFISSNLRAIRDSTDSTKEHQRQILGNIRITKVFPKDVRRYSFNNELSYKVDTLGASASADYKLIYSQNGFLPRSGRLNISSEIFGTNFNVLELNLRQENIENILEYYVGPKGLLNKDFDEIMKMIEIGGASGRGRRSIVDDTTKFSKKYKMYGSKNMDDLNLDFSLKLFGTEMLFLSLGDNIPTSLDDVIKYVSIAFEEVKKDLSDFSKEFAVHSLFLDTEFVYTTALGLPLEISAQGFATSKMKVGFNIDVDAIVEQNWQRAKYRVKAIPSVDLSVNLKLGFNAFALSTGLNVVSSIHSATGGDIALTFINEGQGFNIDIEVPREKIDLVNLQISSNLYIEEQEKPIKEIIPKSLKKDKDLPLTDMCFNQIETAGVKVCVTTNLINLNEIDLHRTLKVHVYLMSELKYNIKGSYLEKSQGIKQWKLNLSTPGSKEPHNTMTYLEFGTQARKYLGIVFVSSHLNLRLEAGINNDNKELVLYGQYEINGDIKRNRIGFIKNGNEYRPIIELHDKNGIINNINGYQVNGKVTVQKLNSNKDRYNFDNLAVYNREVSLVKLNGLIDISTSSFDAELRISKDQESYIVNSNFKVENKEYALGFFVKNEKMPENTLGASVQLKIDEQNIVLKLLGKGNKLEVYTTNDLQFVINEAKNIFELIDLKHELVVKHKQQLLGAIKLNALVKERNKLNIFAEISRNNHRASLLINYDDNQQSQNHVFEINGKLNNHFLEMVSKCHANGNHFLIDATLTSSWGTSATAKGELGQRFIPQDVYVDLQGIVQISGKEKPADWLIKVIGSVEKTVAECKLSSENIDLIKFNGETLHPQEKITGAKLNMIIKNLISAKTDFKIAKNGKGELITTIEMLKIEPNHKIDINSKFHIQAPKYDIETNIILDTDINLLLKTENVLDKTKFSTKNILESANKKLYFDADGLVKGEWRLNGEIQGNFVIKIPDGHVVDGNFKRKITTNPKTGISLGDLKIQLSEQMPNGNKRSLDMVGKADKLNIKNKDISAQIQLDIINFENKKLNFIYNIKHFPKGHNKFVDVGVSVNGDILPTPIDISLIIDEYNERHAIFRLNSKYGHRLNGNINGNFYIAEHGKPGTFELQTNVQAPEMQIKSFELHANGKLLNPSEGGDLHLIELHLNEKAGGKQFIKIDFGVKASRRHGSYSLNLESSNLPSPIKTDGSYSQEIENVTKNGNSSSGKQKLLFNFNFGEKYIKTFSDISFVGSDVSILQFTLDTSCESFKDISVELQSHHIDSETYSFKLSAKQQANVYELDSIFYGASHKKGVDIRIKVQNNQPIIFVALYNLLGERKAKVNVEVKNFLDLDLLANAEASYVSVDDFYVLADWNSVKLALNNYNLEIRSKGKTITLNLKNVHNIVFAGSATYALKREKNKSTIEGQGQLEYNGKSENANFKLVRQHYDPSTDKEIGFSYTLNGNFGPQNTVSTLKMTNKDFNVKLSVCEEKKQCTNIQVQSIVSVDGQENDSALHSLLVLFDLRELGYPYEFELQSKTIRQGFKLNYNLDTKIVSNKNVQYQLIAKISPPIGKVHVKTPSREIALETKQEYPKNGKLFGHYESFIEFYFDKLNKPSDVTRFVSKADLNGSEKFVLSANGEIKFEHPSIRPLSISGGLDINRQQQLIDSKIVFDIFRTPEQKIVATSRLQNTDNGHGFNITTNQNIHSSGLNIQYAFIGHTAINTQNMELSSAAQIGVDANGNSASLYLYANKNKLELLLHALNEEVLNINGEFNKLKHEVQIVSKVKLLSQIPMEFQTILQSNHAKLFIKRPSFIEGYVELKLGKELTFNLNGLNKNLIDGHIALDAGNFLQTSVESNKANIKSFLDNFEREVKKETEVTVQKINHHFENLRKNFDEQIQVVKTSTPDFLQLTTNYQSNLDAIVQELENDPSLRKMAETYHKVYSQILKVVNDFTKSVSGLYENLHKLLIDLHEKIEIMLRDTILPIWEEFIVATTKIVEKLRIELVHLYAHSFEIVSQLFEKYSLQFKNYGKTLVESLKPFSDSVLELTNIIKKIIEEQLHELNKYIESLPTFSALNNEFMLMIEKYKIAENVLQLVNTVFDQMHILPQTPETNEFLSKLQNYIQLKLKNQLINDEQILDELLKLLEKAWRSILINVQLSNLTDYSHYSPSTVFDFTPFFDILSKIPNLLSFRLSIFNFLLNEDLAHFSWKDHLTSWIFFNEFELKGHLVDGRHIITFDGQYLSNAGSCKYILAQDTIDNNFTIVANLNNGKLKSIILADRNGHFLEINDVGTLKLNGNPIEFPIHENEKGLHAWRLFYTVYMRSEYGVEVMCTNDLKVCHVDVNGFYTSKTRGLLGNGNAEPFDDFVQPDGTLASDYQEFVNSYSLGKCNPIIHDTQDILKHSDVCNELFGFDSALAMGYLSIDVAPFRSACDNAVSVATEKDKEAAACTIALSYGSALKRKQKFVLMPSRCLKCVGPAGQREVGQDFTIKIPNNKADIVFVVDFAVTPVVLKNLVAPTITEIRDTLKSRGFTDTQIIVVAFNESERYPALLTSDNGKINYHGNIANVLLNGPKNFCDNCITQVINDKKILDVFEIFENILQNIVPQSDEKAIQLALNYPFRAGAAKAIVGIRSKTFEFGNLLNVVRAHLTGTTNRIDNAQLHLIAPVPDLSLDGVPNEKLIGFNSRLVATLDGKDAKKRQKLNYKNDLSIEFVLNNGGWVFNTNNFDKLKPNDQKKALNQITNSIADTLFKTEIVSDCICAPVHGIHAQHKCSVKSSNFITTKKFKITK